MTIRNLFNKLVSFFKPAKPEPVPFDTKPISTVILVKVGDKVVGAIPANRSKESLKGLDKCKAVKNAGVA